MTRRRFFFESLNACGSKAVLDSDVSHHLWRVLRYRQKDLVELCDGKGRTAKARILGYQQGRVELDILHVTQEKMDVGSTVLLIPWVRSERMDLVVRQAVELDVCELWFFEAARSQYTVKGDQKEKRLWRYQKIARDALCQCGGAWLPAMRFEESLKDVLVHLRERESEGSSELRLLACETEPRETLWALRERYPVVSHIVAAVGPEGGWMDEERHAFQAHGFVPVSLGKNVLRFETACTVLLAAVEVLWKQAFPKQTQGVARMETP